jgi:hypothetical protein
MHMFSLLRIGDTASRQIKETNGSVNPGGGTVAPCFFFLLLVVVTVVFAILLTVTNTSTVTTACLPRQRP